jgi:ligand-binding sensor domain-containing protein
MNNGIVNVINKYGINKIDLKKELKYYKRVIDIIIEDNERVWLGLDEYIAIKQNNRFIIPRYPTDQVIFYYPIKCLAKSQDNRFFAGTNSSVIEIINQNNIIDLSKKYGIYPLRTNAILPDGNRIWVGTENGLYLFKDTASYYGLYDERLRSRITSLKKTARNNVIVGTIDKGVLFISYDGKIISQLSTKNGLLSNNCKMIFQENDSIIWIATSKGAHRINIDQVNSGSFIIKTYNTSNGLISDEVSGIYLRNDTAWIGTSNGVTFFHVYSKDNQNLLAPPIYINQVMINDSILHNNNEYFLSHFMNDIKINYIGLSYKNREEIFYKYKMEGVDSGWKYTSLSTIQFASLHPGKYIFSVFAKNYKGNWSDSPATITFTILPPWWQTWWFRGGVAAVAAGIIYLLFRWRVNVVRKQENTKTELNRKLAEMEMKALRAQMNPHFTFNSLNSIYHFISNNDVESAQKYMSRFASLMRGILDHSRLAYISVEEEIKMLKLYIELESLRFENKFDHEIIVDPSILSEQDEIPSMIIQPYVENAIWHGLMHKEDGKGRLKISIAKREGVIHCAIEDNGIGRARSAELKKSNRGQHKSVGMLITKERLDLLNEINQSSLSMKITDLFIDEKPAGTRVEIFIPVPAGVSSRRPTQTMAAEAGSG